LAVSCPHKEAGFTLVEVLCVLALLGLTAGLVILNLPKPEPSFQTEVKALTTTLNLAARQSVIDGKTRGLDMDREGIEVFVYDGAWVSEKRGDFVGVYGLELDIEGQTIDFNDRAKSKKKLPPFIHFDATGTITPFELSLLGNDQAYEISPDPRGQIIASLQP